MENAEFLRLAFTGARFAGGRIPLNVLGDLAALQSMVLDVAKWRYLAENQQRRRVPRGFSESVALNLTGLGEGSAVPVIGLVQAASASNGVGESYHSYLKSAWEYIVSAVDEVGQGSRPVYTGDLPLSCLAHFDKVGRSLQDEEILHLSYPGRSAPAQLTKAVRLRLVEVSRIKEFTAEVILRGSVSEMDQDGMTFGLDPVYSPKVSGPVLEQHYGTIMEAFTGYRSNLRVLVQGTGRYSRGSSSLSRLDSVEQVTLLDPLDVAARLDEFRDMQDGWLEGEGLAPRSLGMDWLAAIFNRYFPDDAPLPCTYPTVDGGIRMEWSQGDNAFVLEIDLDTHKGEWLWFSRSSENCLERILDLDASGDWDWFASEIINKSAGGYEQ